MGILLNSGNTEFEEAVNAEIYVDKTLLIVRQQSPENSAEVHLRQPTATVRQINGGKYADRILQQGLRFKRAFQSI